MAHQPLAMTSLECNDSQKRFKAMGGVVSYVLFLGLAFGTAMALYFTLRTVKLI